MSSKKRKRPSHAPTAAPGNHTTAPRRRIIDAQEDGRDSRATTPLIPSDATWWANTSEWLRGKAELLWESVLMPMFGWFAAVFEWIGFGRRMRGINGRSMRNTGELRTWNDAGVGMLKRVSRILMVAAVSAAVLVVFSALAVRAVGALSNLHTGVSLGLGSSNSTATPPGAITIRNANGSDNGTPQGIPAYTLGMWMSNMSPSDGEDLTVYAKVCNLSTPIANVKVTFSVGGATTTANTNQDGIATLKFNANGPGSVPQEIDGEVKVGGQDLTASTFYTAI